MANYILQFRVATQDDAAQLQQLVQYAFRAEDSREGWTGDMGLASQFTIKPKEIKAIIAAPESAFLMATDNSDNLVGTVGVSKQGADGGRLFMLAVDHRQHRGGLGRQIVAYAENYCQRVWGVQKMGLNALSTRRTLISWYMRRGYQKTGETSPFPREKFSDLDLPEDICFVEFEKELGPDRSCRRGYMKQVG